MTYVCHFINKQGKGNDMKIMNPCNFCGYKADYIEEYTDQKDISKCLCGACLNEYEKEREAGL